jgi:hypothetical protein
VDWVHLGFVRGPGYAERLAAARPHLRPLLAAHRRGGLAPGDLLSLARPVLLEPDVHLGPGIHALLVPQGLLWRAGGREPGAAAGAPALLPHPESMFVEASRDRQVRGFFGFRTYGDALLACARGLRADSALRLSELRRLLPEDERARALAAGCQRPAH